MKTKVVHLRKHNYDVYIGRTFAEFAESIFKNPFHIGKDGDRDEVLLKFIEYWYAPEQTDIRHLAAKVLYDKTLGCWCKPKSCHGDIIAGYVNWKTENMLF